jgi:Uma2 family endonuclease
MSTVSTTYWSDIPQLPLGPENRVRFSREAYHRMFETGMLSNEKRYELIDGEVVMMSPLGPSNSSIISRLAEFLVKQLPEKLQCRVQLPIVVDDHSEPEPDLAVVNRREDDYRHYHPKPSDVVMIVEVSTTSLNFDLKTKQQLYAKSKIAEYWVVDVERGMLVVHRQPGVDGYTQRQEFDANSIVAPLAAPNCQLDLRKLLG